MTRPTTLTLRNAVIVGLMGFASIASVLLAAPGALDPSLDSDGLLLTSLAPPALQSGPVAVQADERIVVAGTIAGAGGIDFAVARYNRDGTPDTAFSGDGIQTIPIAPGSGADTPAALAIQKDGKIVVVGTAEMGGGTGDDYAVVRLRTDGTLDDSFSGDGVQTVTFRAAAADDTARGVAFQGNGKIIIVGSADMGGPSGIDIGLARLGSNGELDPTFAGGAASFAVGSGTANDQGRGVALAPDGSIMVAGSTAATGNSSDPTRNLALMRITETGLADASFSGDGREVADISALAGASSNDDRALALVRQSDGRLVVTGATSVGAPGEQLLVARFTESGALDPSFSGDGVVTVDAGPGDDEGRALSQQPDGALVAVGRQGTSSGAVVRLLSNGGLDSTFAGSGILSLPQTGVAGGVALTPQTDVVVAGATTGVTVARLTGDRADLSGSAAAIGTATVGVPLSVAITVRNDGPQDAVGVTLQLVLPAGASVVPAPGSCGGVPLACQLGDIGAGRTATATVTLTPTTPGPIQIVGEVLSITHDASRAGNTVQFATTAQLPAVPVEPADRSVPSLRAVMVPRTLRLSAALPTLTQAGGSRTIDFVLSEDARVRLSFVRGFPGRQAGPACLPPRRSNQRRPRCTRFLPVSPVFAVNAKAGLNRLLFRGRLTTTRVLVPGRYRVIISAKDAAGNESRVGPISFTLLASQ
jgi:uncharacterized delta-60 repeat protein/uncharacterized repeat protein (TIGR01451 family)